MDKDFMKKVLAEADKMDKVIENAKMEIRIEKGHVDFNASNGNMEAYGFMILTALCNIAERVPDMRGYLASACRIFLLDYDNDDNDN